jgi:hypothetical protein
MREWRQLEKEVGRTVTQDEVWEWDSANRDRLETWRRDAKGLEVTQDEVGDWLE